MNLTAFVSLEEFYQRKLCPSELVSVFHTAAIVPETTSELEQLKEQVEKLTGMVVAIPVRQQCATVCEETVLPL